MRIGDYLIARISRRAPDLVIGDPPYLRRWYVIPRNPLLNIYLHNIVRSDDDRALHDHPWWNLSWLLRGYYREVVSTPGGTTALKFRGTGSLVLRRSRTAHRLVIDHPEDEATWSLFITGPRLRQWGFWCPGGWIHWRAFTSGPNGEIVGRGCGEAT